MYPRICDYTPAACWIFILYLFGWFPGFLMNLFKLIVALIEKDSYDQIDGFGCLVALFIVCGLGPLVLLAGAYVALMHLY